MEKVKLKNHDRKQNYLLITFKTKDHYMVFAKTLHFYIKHGIKVTKYIIYKIYKVLQFDTSKYF